MPWDTEHGGRFTYKGEHRPDDREMTESKRHAALEKAFRRSEDEYHQHTLIKPSFKDFKLQFQTPKQQVPDQIPPEVVQDHLDEEYETEEKSHVDYRHHEQRRLEELGINRDDFF